MFLNLDSDKDGYLSREEFILLAKFIMERNEKKFGIPPFETDEFFNCFVDTAIKLSKTEGVSPLDFIALNLNRIKAYFIANQYIEMNNKDTGNADENKGMKF